MRHARVERRTHERGASKKLIAAVVVSREPENFPCGGCGCDAEGRAASGERWKIHGADKLVPVIDTDRCPRKSITPRSRFFMELHVHYRRGLLPVAGGLLDQPAAYFDAMTILEQWSANG